MMILILLALVLVGFFPAYSEVYGSVSGALKAIQVAKKQHRPIIYYGSWNKALPTVSAKADAYEGMMLNTSEDFMKNEPIMVIMDSKLKQKSGQYRVTEEVIYPVWSPRNHRHVLRSAKISFVVSGNNYIGLDGRSHPLRG